MNLKAVLEVLLVGLVFGCLLGLAAYRITPVVHATYGSCGGVPGSPCYCKKPGCRFPCGGPNQCCPVLPCPPPDGENPTCGGCS